jgi:hypothetical protein
MVFNPEFFVLTLALVGVVIIVAALLSGLIDCSDLPQVGVFLALGAMLGPAGWGCSMPLWSRQPSGRWPF